LIEKTKVRSVLLVTKFARIAGKEKKKLAIQFVFPYSKLMFAGLKGDRVQKGEGWPIKPKYMAAVSQYCKFISLRIYQTQAPTNSYL